MDKQERVIDVLRYLPEFLRGVKEFEQIAAVQDRELELLYEQVDALWRESFLAEAGVLGLKRYEGLLGLLPYPGDTLNERRSAVQMKWNVQLPYTLLRLEERLNVVLGKDGYELHVRYGQYELELLVLEQTYRILQKVRDMTKDMIPANLLFLFAGKFSWELAFSPEIAGRLRLLSQFYARYNREFLLLDDTWYLDGTYQLNGYKEKAQLDLYQAKLKMGAPVKEKVYGELSLTVEKDLWYLDGTYKLDSTKYLDAEIAQFIL